MKMNSNCSGGVEVGKAGIEDTSTAFAHKMSERHIRVAVIGNVDAGKSTLIGTLKSGQLDNGKGQARAFITKHRHEIESGRTSTISSHLIGYDEGSNPIVRMDTAKVKGTHTARKKDAEVAAQAHSLVTLVDLAGHEKYLKSTLHGISSGMIDYALVLVNSRHPPTHMTIHHIHLAVTFNIPIIVAMTKVDGCPKHAMDSMKQELNKILRSPKVQKKPFQIKQMSDVPVIQESLHAICPLVSISCVTGEGLGLLHHLLASLPKRRRHQNKIGRTLEFLVEDVFQKTKAGGGATIVSGFVNAGKVAIGEKVLVGPFQDGTFKTTQVKSIHIEQTHVVTAVAGNSTCLALALGKEHRKLLRAGMYVLGSRGDDITVPVPSETFVAEMTIVRGSGVDGTTITDSYETMVHVLHIKQCARVEHVELLDDHGQGAFFQDEERMGAVVRPGNKALITFRFKQHKEYLRPGMRVAFRDGHLRGCGVITQVS